MKIDRTRFLILTGAIAAAACSSTTNNPTDAGTVSPQPDATTGGTDAATGDADITLPDTGTTDTGTTETGTDAGTCDDSVVSVTACASFSEGGFDGSVPDAGTNGCLTAPLCTDATNNLKPKVAAAAIACVVSLPTCEGDGVGTCVGNALAGACPDSAAAATCTAIATACADGGDAGISSTDCNKYASGLTAAGRTAFVGCMTESLCDVAVCLGQLF